MSEHDEQSKAAQNRERQLLEEVQKAWMEWWHAAGNQSATQPVQAAWLTSRVMEVYQGAVTQPSTYKIGHARYEALRKLNLREFSELYKRNMHGENFDALVDELVNAK